MKELSIRMVAGALVFATAPCASAPSAHKRSDASASVRVDGTNRTQTGPPKGTASERNSEHDRIHRELVEARARLARTEARIRREDGQQAADDLTRSVVEEKTTAALRLLSPIGGVTIRDAGKDTIIVVKSLLLFAPDSSELQPQAVGVLGSVAEALAQDGESRVLVVDRSAGAPSDDAAGAELSQKRSDAVRDFFVSRGVRSSLVSATTRESGSVTDDSTRVDQEKGQRLEIIVGSMQGR